MAHQQLNTSERKAFYYRHNSEESARSIAKRLGGLHTTIICEVKKSKPRYGTYFDEIAVEKAAQCRSIARHERKRSNIKRYSYVVRKLECSCSPEVISGLLKNEYPDDHSMRTSHKGIYQWRYKGFKEDR